MGPGEKAMTIRHPEAFRAGANDDGRRERCNPRLAAAWILAAFGLLVAGLVSGTLLYSWRRDLGWIPLLISFAGYIAAFRRAMLFWDCDIDRSWRTYLWIDGGKSPRRGADPAVGPNRPVRALR